jgi:Flp pilus assembly protein TadG
MRVRGTSRGYLPARRRGAILVLAALMMVVLLGFVALAVDIGVLAGARAQLKTVADSAALAGVRELADDSRLGSTLSKVATLAQAASTRAIAFGQANSVLNQSAVVLTGDVKVGVKTLPNPTDSIFAVSTGLNTNSVQVTATRDGSHAGIVPAFFGRIFNAQGWSPSVVSTATVEIFQIKGFNTTSNQNAGIMPFALDKTVWDQLNIQKADSYSYSPSNGTVSNGPDGVYEVNMYPLGSGPGNFGTIDIGSNNNGTSTVGDQISSGVTSAQMQAEFGGSTATLPHWFGGNTGVSGGLKDNLNGIIGQPRAVLLYTATNGGSGNNLQYQATSWAAVLIVNVDMTGNPKTVTIQPAFLTDPTVIPDYGNPGSWTSGGVLVLHLTR